MAAKLTRLTHRIAIQLHLVTESSTICSSRSRQSVRKLLNTHFRFGNNLFYTRSKYSCHSMINRELLQYYVSNTDIISHLKRQEDDYRWVDKDLVGHGHGLFQSTILAFVLIIWRRLKETSVRRASRPILTYSMVQDSIWNANCHSACQKISCFLMEPEGSLPSSRKLVTGPYPEPAESSSSHRSLSP
jgi:hypothetical protein